MERTHLVIGRIRQHFTSLCRAPSGCKKFSESPGEGGTASGCSGFNRWFTTQRQPWPAPPASLAQSVSGDRHSRRFKDYIEHSYAI